MNIYIVPIADYPTVKVERIVANSLEQAEDKLYQRLFDKYEDVEADDLNSLRKELRKNDILVGDLYDIEDFVV